MLLSAGTRLGAYEIQSALGAGGMGEVYRARDTKLGRHVALKILPDVFTRDPEHLARFQREAHVLAALNHPHIGAIYGLEDANGQQLLILELVDGETLADRIAKGPIPLGEALPIARQVAEALEAAHEQGIVHRDLKPANIALTHDGNVKVLDFGLAKAAGSSASVELANSPTITSPALMTGIGVILGTAAYMSPEQARGKAVDKRSDLWAFGCVLFEMLTGKRAFQGDDVTDTIAAVVRGEPDWLALPASLPPYVRAIVTGCLQKDRRLRFSDISVPAFLMSGAAGLEMSGPVPVAARRSFRRRAFPVLGGAVVASVVTAAISWALRPVPPAPIVTRFSIPLGEGVTFSNTGRAVLAISPDGTRIAFVANRRLYLRAITDTEARPIAGTEGFTTGMNNPAFSPDGQSIAFYADNELKRIPVTGGAAVAICPSVNPNGVTWQGNEILFEQPKSIMHVAASGGKPEPLVKVNPGDIAHGPQLLPGGNAVLFTLTTGKVMDNGLWTKARIVVQVLEPPAQKIVLTDASDARYLPTGHLVYAAGGVMSAVQFDPDRLAVVGTPFPVVEGVLRAVGSGSAQFSVADNGSLVYIAGPASSSGPTDAVALMDRDGHLEALKMPDAFYRYPRLSPDGKLVAVETDDEKGADIWIGDVSGATAARRLTFAGHSRDPVWTADGERVAFQSDREGDAAIFWQRADGTGTPERLTKPEPGTAHVPQSWAPDGKHFLFTVNNGEKNSLWVYSLADKQAVPYGGVEAKAVITATFSPGGQWVAYYAGQPGTFVQAFPASATKYQVAGGLHPFWSREGTELFVGSLLGLHSVRVSTTPSFAFGPPVDLPKARFPDRGPGFERGMDIMPDGKRFVVIVPSREFLTGAAAVPQIQVVEHWFEYLKARVSIK
jgi:eukaryotic-like serine/threonine-protein kinase